MRKCSELKGQVLVLALERGEAFIDKDMKPYWNKCYECETELTVTCSKCNSTTVSDRWQPIETAPKDGTEIILSNNESSFSGFYHDGSQCKLSDAGFFFECDRDNLLIARSIHVVKWMPLPPP